MVGGTCVPSLIATNTTINQLESNNNLLPEAICKLIASEVMLPDTCVPSLTVINTTIEQLETNVSLKTTYCLRLFVVIYKHIYNVVASEVMVGDTCTPSLIVIGTTINQF